MTEGFNGTVTRRSSLEGKTHNGRGYIEETTWIEPALDSRWSDLDKLRWQAAVVSHDTGLTVTVREAPNRGFVQVRTDYNVSINGTSAAMTGGFHRTWDHLVGITHGAQAARAHLDHTTTDQGDQEEQEHAANVLEDLARLVGNGSWETMMMRWDPAVGEYCLHAELSAVADIVRLLEAGKFASASLETIANKGNDA